MAQVLRMNIQVLPRHILAFIDVVVRFIPHDDPRLFPPGDAVLPSNTSTTLLFHRLSGKSRGKTTKISTQQHCSLQGKQD